MPMPLRPCPAGSLAEAVAGWRPEILMQKEAEEDEDLEAMAAMEDLTPEEHLRLRLRYIKERRQAAQRAGPIGREEFLKRDAEITAVSAQTREASRRQQMPSGQRRNVWMVVGRTSTWRVPPWQGSRRS